MKFDVVDLNRIVELDDEIVAEYCRYKPLSEDPFVIVAISEYGHEPTAQEVSDEELSKLCNEVLWSSYGAVLSANDNFGHTVSMVEERRICLCV